MQSGATLIPFLCSVFEPFCHRNKPLLQSVPDEDLDEIREETTEHLNRLITGFPSLDFYKYLPPFRSENPVRHLNVHPCNAIILMIQRSDALECGAWEPLVLKGWRNIHWVDIEVRPFAWSLLGQVILPRICEALISPSVIHVSWYATVGVYCLTQKGS